MKSTDDFNVHYDHTDFKQLSRTVNSEKVEKRMYDRAKIILLHLKGMSRAEISRELKIRWHTADKWIKRYTECGLEGLNDKQRSGRPKEYNDETRSKILETIELAPPKGQATWDGNAITRETGIPNYAVWGILRKEGIQLNRKRSWCVSKDKNFTQKAADIIGLYLDPPANAIVLSIDEKPSIQALQRSHGYVKSSSGKIIRGEQSTYKRNGTTNLMAALEIATGKVITKTTAAKKREDFLGFMNEVIAKTPADKEVHVILDNYCTHKNNDEWLAKNPNVTFHFTPTSASWLNMVEIWFGILTRKALVGASFESVDELCLAINQFIEVYHKTAKPFKWKKREVKGSQLKNIVANFVN